MKIFKTSHLDWTRTQNHLVLTQTLNKSGQFGQMVECSSKN